MLDFLGVPDIWAATSLLLALAFVLAFEFINGFHDTANAVATVIYTKAMAPYRAVMLSGIFNFLGVLLGGVGVAYAIVHLLPVELLINVDTGRGLAMVFSLLAAAIAWNLGTWYFGIPASSSHTLIGSILGVGITNALLNKLPLVDGVNWQKAIDIVLSLVFSPLAGFAVAGLLLLALKRWRPLSKMHAAPEIRIGQRKKKPPFWNRLVLVLSAITVSFVHGSNDGQKGVGLIMLVLICFVPAQYVLDLNASPYQIERTRDAVAHMQHFYERNPDRLTASVQPATGSDDQPYRCEIRRTTETISTVLLNLKNVEHYADLTDAQRVQVRRDLLCLDETARHVSKLIDLDSQEKADLQRLRKDLTATTEYAPLWVIVAIALALGLGTVVGWRRVAFTIGERIGKQGMTYAQGMSAQITATLAIGAANLYSLPVSTTHVLSSGIAGTMVANRSGLQTNTIRAILIAWILTFPAAMLLSAGIFWLAAQWV
ncbi:phosphate transporter [Betaproteobacteria bacterium]|nr:phosphate transporter [Betaproteobacteria bacterium]GHT99278.1 phosphate transporter [Betaproteobacteria bacterium]GHT99836.1 phosphate transporter [Betaproteobacteria bacterium]GHU07283.1 phosphate transporter [Betaproteobacteria bacterium]